MDFSFHSKDFLFDSNLFEKYHEILDVHVVLSVIYDKIKICFLTEKQNSFAPKTKKIPCDARAKRVRCNYSALKLVTLNNRSQIKNPSDSPVVGLKICVGRFGLYL